MNTATTAAKIITTGAKLKARCIGDSEITFTAEVIERKGNFAIVKAHGNTNRMKVYADDKGEYVYALGKYSMAPIFRA